MEVLNQYDPQNLNTEGMHMVQTEAIPTLLTIGIYRYVQYSIKNAIIVGCLVGFEGMKAVSRPCAKGSQTL